MATIGNDKGLRRILFVDGDKRKTVRLGRVSAKIAESVKIRIEAILASRRAGFPLDADVSFWLGAIDDTLHGRLASAGLVPGRQPASLAALVAEMPDYPNLRTAETAAYETARIVGFFGDVDVRSVTPGRAALFLDDLLEHYAPATAGKTIIRARHVWKAAIERGITTSNPFAKVIPPPSTNRDRIVFVDGEAVAAVMASCLTMEWQTIFALARFGGLRIPSELHRLRPEDIDWKDQTIVIRRGKTKERLIPFYEELRPYLTRKFAPITFTREQLRVGLLQIVKRAGLEPWPRIWHNLRASRQTELEDVWRTHVVCEWMGNSPAIGRQHYLAATDEHRRQAAQKPAHRYATERRPRSRKDAG